MTETSPLGTVCRIRPEVETRDEDARYVARAKQGVAAPLVDLARPVIVSRPNGQPLTITAHPNVENYCVGLEERADPRLAAPLRIAVDLRK